MTCAEVHAAVRDGNVDTPGNRTHAETCVACAQILAHPEPWHTASSAAGASTLPPETLDLLAEAIVVNAAGSTRPLSAQRHAVRWLVTATAALAICLFTWAQFPRPDLPALDHWSHWTPLLTLTGLATCGIALALQPLDRPSRPTWVHTGALVGMLGVSGAVSVFSPGHLVSSAAWVQEAVGCLVFGGAFATISFSVWYQGERRSFLDTHTASLAAVGCAMVGQAALQIHCPISDLRHLLLGHAALGLLALAITRLALRPLEPLPSPPPSIQ